ncbi:hypothetical protein FOL47_002926 [Perkinsus chesapeaki]|uniref:Uncharacterized protein n=1 Tax=Perkinsus chesapeaki TaxID=330153 RepID=A0A7J6MBB3_PERCH|nr:hypothetical protein FOL47_002926 [Perkinsus chesapeaki]
MSGAPVKLTEIGGAAVTAMQPSCSVARKLRPNVEARPSNYDSDGYSNDGGSIATTVALSAREDNDIEVGDLPGSMPVGDLEIEDLPDLAADNNSQYSEDADSLTATEVDIQNSEELGDDDNGHSNMQSDISPPSESEISIENLPDFRPHRELSDNLETTEAFNCAVTVTSSSSELSIEDL